jgi:2-dehydro-3-deoxygalactonokinase
MSEHLVLADWGTSNLRLWVLDEAGRVRAQAASPDGADGLPGETYAPLLRARLQALGIAPAASLPVVVCGMAGARQGWREAGYVPVPAAPSACLGQAVPISADGLEVRILPGLAQTDAHRPDVMRGEETQLLGFLAADPGFSGIICLPGTHNKWVYVAQGQISRFQTAMTGEIFALLSRRSVLRHVIGGAEHFTPDAPAFAAALGEALAQPAQLPFSLFQIRAAGLLAGQTGAAAAARLSGLLIGTEVAAALSGATAGGEVMVLASGALAPLYAQAVTRAGWSCRLRDAEPLTLAGLETAARHFFPAFFKG